VTVRGAGCRPLAGEEVVVVEEGRAKMQKRVVMREKDCWSAPWR
jgi:hypothetical protein